MTRPDAAAKSDARLRRARRDSAAFRVLYDRHAGRIHAFQLSAGAETRRGDGADGRDVRPSVALARAIRRSRRRDGSPVALRDRPECPGRVGSPTGGGARRTGTVGARAVADCHHRRRDLARRPRRRPERALAGLPDGQRRAIELRILADRPTRMSRASWIAHRKRLGSASIAVSDPSASDWHRPRMDDHSAIHAQPSNNGSHDHGPTNSKSTDPQRLGDALSSIDGARRAAWTGPIRSARGPRDSR